MEQFQMVTTNTKKSLSIFSGTSPTLFNQEDEVIQLDEGTFNDTIFCTSKTEKDVSCGASYIINL